MAQQRQDPKQPEQDHSRFNGDGKGKGKKGDPMQQNKPFTSIENEDAIDAFDPDKTEPGLRRPH